ncbi:hypothetical protein PGT21_032088 [Puccinia graminis f. sp. tritici]|uniref:Conidiation-specific protein 6 n=2 Tax=Puccinia graminis f. sp. tritici TaxID=56615 RepID=E3JT23_PUCGT|nr:uncharacterized protein PGTG_01843 [Puccinia graminis f. sp. tritici CRL 75-36-700-3]EFP75250.2 hypothetical protein PGTG_01843 [Puccinia graminis f. sp. tritici CRL 75-36-700-3]KAA1100125.1 hypothetical protein PGT21_029988 [Puccinia graminis f. sp. tritici]KAA1118128.1 hypothetical protein PGT21_032088 [Puccinia graminis f. sp. tritici]KAA1120703.1 hypothetical protein PGTUg99_024201 [Puccinia graminis f. sp. tritici]
MSTQSKTMAHANDGDQKNASQAETQESRYEAGQLHSHLGNDPKDQRSIANRLESELRKKDDDSFNPDPNIPNKGQKPTDLAKEHGHQPSRGAEIDEEIRQEEEAELRKKGINP